ncbi:ABC transporter ATP-binding protein [Candidatus Halobonum tyrrellensis]|uniref:Oligopeptide/dipeptide ABC transporter ATP-binding protein n=1 Tax=Candidatus Halobonum tyrrellensis G22 TaxID=1324957 RepID=V4GTN0_9EURY|nr:ABC transporter ATP-binding protein [Candidatus Halobonum tyrrellensis]ESP88466.1 oligopeptide/dipeptide ABC transporter ATP-binding protein [Candidatus Halobonum tyrrellensis G22]
MAMLEVEDLKVYYDTAEGAVKAVDGVSFEIEEGENLGIVGESGCGKSTLAKALIGILPQNGYIAGGEIRFRGEDLTEAPERRRRELRWDEISMIAQSAMNALDPVYTIRQQILEAIEAHHNWSRTKSQERIDEMFDLVGLDRERQTDYPHQFSGGMRQRAMIAMSLVLEPSLILADEPTTALDVIMQDQILKRINEIQEASSASMMVITHDVAVVAETCDRVVVMYAGEIAEEGPAAAIFDEPYHPYTLGLKSAFPNIREADQDLVSIGGHPPDLHDPPTGCRFAERCPMATEVCSREDPPEVEVGGLRSYCHHVDDIDTQLRPVADRAETWQNTDAADDRGLADD